MANTPYSKMRDLIYMSRDFLRILRGKDYFHEPAHLGRYFIDEKSYYYDFSIKADWMGERREGIPFLYVPAWDETVPFPIMILQFGLGSVDRFFNTGNPDLKMSIIDVTRWIERNLLANGSFDNLFPRISPLYKYYSANSALAQGHALSFLSRVQQFNLVPRKRAVVGSLLEKIYFNMVQPLAEGGTALIHGEDIAFCEVCRQDDYVVLNGWIYALFGLLDYRRLNPGPQVEGIVLRSLRSLENALPEYLMKGGWSLYDNKGRVSSPIYHASHVVLVEALWLLTKRSGFQGVWRCFKKGNNITNRVWFLGRKVIEKVLDRQAYLTR